MARDSDAAAPVAGTSSNVREGYHPDVFAELDEDNPEREASDSALMYVEPIGHARHPRKRRRSLAEPPQGDLDRVEEIAPNGDLTGLSVVPGDRGRDLVAGLGIDPNRAGHLPRRFRSMSPRTVAQSCPCVSPRRARSARRSISAAQA